MKSVIDALSDSTGWIGESGVSVHSLNDVEDYIAGFQDASLIFSFDSDSAGKGITRAYSEDVSDYDQLTFSVWSRNLRNGSYSKFTDCPYSIIINGSSEYGVLCYDTFDDITIDISEIDSISSIKFEAKTDEEDFLLVSYMVVSVDEFPYDCFESLKEKLELVRDEVYPEGLFIGTVAATQGDESLDVSGSFSYLSRYSVVTIKEGGLSETHQLGDLDDNGYTMSTLFDGKSVVNDYTSAELYLQFPIDYYKTETEIMLPGFTIFGMEGEPVQEGSKHERIYRSFTPDGFLEEETNAIIRWSITIEIVSRSLELNAKMATMIRESMNSQVIWINGRKSFIDFTETPIEELPNESFDVIPKLAYNVNIEVKERIWKKNLPTQNAASLTIQVQ